VLEPRGDQCLAPEPHRGLAAGLDQLLDRDRAAEPAIARRDDPAHAAARDLGLGDVVIGVDLGQAREVGVAAGGIVAAAHSASHATTGFSVAAATNVHACHADTVNVNAANAVNIRSRRDRSSTDNPIARIRSDASRAETAWMFTSPV
jgi:hypothetical protein